MPSVGMRPAPDTPLPPDDRFGVDVARFVERAPGPVDERQPPANPPVDVLRVLEAQAQLDVVIG